MRVNVGVVLSVLTGCLLPVDCQQPMPFQGVGDLPPGKDALPVYVSAFVDRLLEVNDQTYRFKAVVFFYLSWTDPRFKSQVVAATNASLNDPNYNNGQGCNFTCQSSGKVASGGCCDNVFLPHVEHTNIFGLSQDRVIRYGIGWDPRTVNGSDNVYWWTSVNGEYYTPFDLRAFPFDRQNLKIQMEIPQARVGWSGGYSQLLPSVTGSHLFNPSNVGDDVSGWSIEAVDLEPYNYPLCEPFFRYAAGTAPQTSNVSDPAPLVPAFVGDDSDKVAGSCNAVIESGPDPQASPMWRHSLAGTDAPGTTQVSGPITVYGLYVNIRVKRHSGYYIASVVLPIMLSVYLSILVFFLKPTDLEARLGAVLALFLALAAIQFVVSQNLPASSYVTPVGQLIIASYFSVFIVGVESLIAYKINIFCVLSRQRRQGKEAISRWRTLKHGSAMVPQSGPGDSTQAADRLGYPPPDRLASKPSLDSVAELVSEDDVDGPTAQENASKLSDSQGEGGDDGAPEQLQSTSHSPARCLKVAWTAVSWPFAAVRRRWREFNEHLARDEALAEAISRRLDVWAAIGLFSAYTLTAVLIFAINGSLYGNA